MDDVSPEPRDNGRDEHDRRIGFMPPIAAHDLGNSAADPGNFLIAEDREILAV